MARSEFRQWLINRIPLESPRHFEVKIAGEINDFGYVALEEVSLPVLNAPKFSEDLATLHATLFPTDLSLEKIQQHLLPNLISEISLPGITLLPIDRLSDNPEIFDLLKKLEIPGRTGKVYIEDLEEGIEIEPMQISMEMMEKCRHGLQKYY